MNQTARKLATIANAACTIPQRIAASDGLLAQFKIDAELVSAAVLQEAITLFRRMAPRLEPDAKLLRHLAGEQPESQHDIPSPVPQPKQTRKAFRFQLFGYSVTSVLRYMGLHGWTYEDAAVAMASCGAAAISNATIRTQLQWGRTKIGGAAAPLTSSQAKQLKHYAQ